MGRAPCCDKTTVKRGPWSPEEDAALRAYVDEHGTGSNWIALPHKIGLKRCGKSCRLRWLNYLRPNIRHGDFTPEEDSTISGLYISIGSRWSIIAAQLPGRTDNDVKNYWNTKLKKRLLGGRRRDRGGAGHRQSAAAANDQLDGGGASLSASAMERIQLCMRLQEMHSGYPLQLWPDQQAATKSDSGGGGSFNDVTAAELERSDESPIHLIGQRDSAAAAAMDGGQASPPSSTENSDDVVNIDAELQELLHGGGATPTQQQGEVDWWSYDQVKPSSPASCWDFAPEASSAFQDYASVYDMI